VMMMNAPLTALLVLSMIPGSAVRFGGAAIPVDPGIARSGVAADARVPEPPKKDPDPAPAERPSDPKKDPDPAPAERPSNRSGKKDGEARKGEGDLPKSADRKPLHLAAELNGQEVVPVPGDPDGHGTVTVDLDREKLEACFSLSVTN